LNRQPSGGAAPCHALVDRTGSNLLVANYTGGTVAVFPISTEGRLGPATALIQHAGRAPHPHCVTLDATNRVAWVCDLGLDRVFAYRFDAAAGTLAPHTPPWTSLASGSGPRHMVFDPQYRRAYVLCELNSTIVGLDHDAVAGTLKEFQTLSSLPPGWKGQNSGAEIAVHPSGRFLYASNRGCNTVAVFALDSGTGRLTPVQQQSVGLVPRHFAIDPTGAFCLVANQDSDDVRLYQINPQTGELSPTGRSVKVSRPVCVLPILTRPPQPVVTAQHIAADSLELRVDNAVGQVAYRLEQSVEPRAGGGWTPVVTGVPGQTRFTLSCNGAFGFLRAAVAPGY
jgi:6-phosphogluconolactonase